MKVHMKVRNKINGGSLGLSEIFLKIFRSETISLKIYLLSDNKVNHSTSVPHIIGSARVSPALERLDIEGTPVLSPIMPSHC